VTDQLFRVPSLPGPIDPEVQESARLARLAEYRVVPLASSATVSPADKLLVNLRGITELARLICGVEIAMVNLIDADHQHMLAAHGVPGGVCAREDSMCAVVFGEGQTVVVPDAREDPRFVANPFVTGVIDTLRFYGSADLVTDSGHSLGMLCVADHEPRVLNPRQQAALRALAAQTVDVLELHRHTRMLSEANQRLTRSNTMLAEFAGRVSHDLQAPLSSITGFAEVLGELPVLAGDESAGQFIQRIRAAGDRMSTTIGELLAYARAGADLTLHPVDLSALMVSVLDDLDAQVRASGARIDVDVTTVLADAGQLRALLQNLLTNAMKYRRPDVPCAIQVLSQITADGWFLRVCDNGMGIPEPEREHILQPMARLQRDRDSTIAGTGIGLATVQRIAQAHNGRLDITETPGGGATITLYVPARA
jgi:signal transduction histidine kinase